MRITADGLVGIGTTSPGHVLDVSGGNIRLVSNNSALIFRNNYQSITTDSAGNDLTYRTYQSHIWKNVTSTGSVSDGTERMRIDSSGRLLVGTSTSPSVGALAQYSLLKIQGNSGSATATAILNIARGQAATSIVNGANIGAIAFTDSSGNEFGTIVCTADAAAGSGDYPGRLTFSTTADGASSPTERMRIASDGKISTFSSDDYVLYVSSATSSTSGAITLRAGATGIGGGTATLNVRHNGNVENQNNSYGALSDAKLKENIVDANPQWNDLKSLQVRSYNFKEETGHSTHTQIGLIAQEVELVSPGLVSESPDRDEDGNDLGTVTKSVNYSVLYMKAVKALQEAMERIETLEQRLNDAGIA